jgi:predicted TIM-barrel fold metal-dependent hydrolase
MRTNVHVHFFSADHTPPQQLYYLLRGALHSTARHELESILGRAVTAADLRDLDTSLDRYAFPWPQAVPAIIGDGLVEPKKLIDMFTTISRIDRGDAERILGVDAQELAKDMTAGLLARIDQKRKVNDAFPFRAALCDVVAELFAAHEKGVQAADGKRLGHDVVWQRYQDFPGASQFGRLVALSVNFDQAFGREPLPGLGAKPAIRFKGQQDELLALAAANPSIVPFFCIESRGYNPGALLDFVQKNVGQAKPWKGLKMYPPMGVKPTDYDVAIFQHCQDNGIPVLTHCSIGGAGVRGSSVNFAEWAEPKTWRSVLDALRSRWKQNPTPTKFKLCFAHFDGLDLDPRFSWSKELIDLMAEFDGSEGVELYADVAFNTVGGAQSIGFYEENLQNIRAAGVDARVLYGTDWWMYLYSETDESSFEKQLHVDDPARTWWKSADMETAADAFLGDVL